MAYPTDWDAFVRKAVVELKPHVKEFDVIACQGLSGIMVGVPLAYALKKQCCVVRKSSDYGGGCSNTDWLYTKTGRPRAKQPRVLYVDDWIAGGHTRNRVGYAIHTAGGTMTCQYLYAQNQMGRRDGSPQGFSKIQASTVRGFARRRYS